MSITFTKKIPPTNARLLGVRKTTEKYDTDYALFHFTFIGYNFFCNHTQEVKTKLQVFLANKQRALQMANTLMVPAQYSLIEYTPNKLRKHVA